MFDFIVGEFIEVVVSKLKTASCAVRTSIRGAVTLWEGNTKLKSHQRLDR